MIQKEDAIEFIGQIIDIFEDFLEAKKIDIPNPDKEQSGDGAAIIYGTDYDDLRNNLANMMIIWGVVI